MSQATMSLTALKSPAELAPTDASGEHETVIRPKRGWIGIDWPELVSHRELLYFLTWRDVKVKYKQAIFGSAWAIVVPLVSVIIYSVVGIAAGFASRTMNGVPYPVYIYAALLPWQFLQTAINGGGMSLVNNQALLSKIYMPRLFIPTSMIGSAMVDMFMSSIVFVGMLGFFYLKTHGNFHPDWHVIFIPPLLVVLTISAMGTAYFLSALTVMFRDLKFIIPFIVQLGIWLTAVVYPQTIFTVPMTDPTTHQIIRDAAGQAILKHDFRPWLAINPYAGIIQAFRWAITGEPLQVLQLTTSCIYAVVLLVAGLFYFKRVERRFADIA
ncbi:MAG: ABC transporter permease [Tepidisphaeraceae bacterium]